jgi:hypothetical protein
LREGFLKPISLPSARIKAGLAAIAMRLKSESFCPALGWTFPATSGQIDKERKMKSYDLNLGADENCVMHYLEEHPGNFISEMEVARHADGRHRFQGDTHWAHIALSQLVEMNLVDTDGQGRYRVHADAADAADSPGPARKFIDPRLREILERSGKKFDLSRYA